MRTLALLAAAAVGAAAAPYAARTTAVAARAPLSQPAPADTIALNRLLAEARGARPLFCELLVRAVDGRVWWSNSGSGAGGPLEVDSAAGVMIRWIHTAHSDPGAVPRLAMALRDPDQCVRRVAGSMLGRVDHLSAAAALLGALEDGSAATRAAAAIGLGIAEHQPALRSLIARLRDPSPDVRRTAAWALGELESKEAMLPLIELLERDADPRVRQAAAAAIGQVTS